MNRCLLEAKDQVVRQCYHKQYGQKRLQILQRAAQALERLATYEKLTGGPAAPAVWREDLNLFIYSENIYYVRGSMYASAFFTLTILFAGTWRLCEYLSATVGSKLTLQNVHEHAAVLHLRLLRPQTMLRSAHTVIIFRFHLPCYVLARSCWFENAYKDMRRHPKPLTGI